MGEIEVRQMVRDNDAQDTQTTVVSHRLFIRPIGNPDLAVDVSEPIVQAVAHTIWQNVGGNDALNWLEAEQFVQELLGHLAGRDLSGSADVRTVHVEPESEAPSSKAAMTIEPKGQGVVDAAAAADVEVDDDDTEQPTMQLQHAA